MISAPLPGCTDVQSHILQLRARGLSYREVGRQTRLAPRRVYQLERQAIAKLVHYHEQQAFLEPRGRIK